MTPILSRKSIIIAAFLAANLLLPVSFGAEAAHERPDRGPFAFEFRFRQTDLATQHGAHSVLRTLVYQATRACEDTGEAPLSLRRTDTECVAALVERVVRQINSETLASEWRSRRQSPTGVAVAQAMK